MKASEVLARTRAPDGTELTLLRHPSEYVILADGEVLMSSRLHGSEEGLALLGCQRARGLTRPHVLVGGLGMGFTLRAALDVLPRAARVLVAELAPTVVEWNRGVLGALAHHPLDDPRVRVRTTDVAGILRTSPAAFDAVLLDLDNGPVALTASSNSSLYDAGGVASIRASLRPGGLLAVWSAGDDRRFERRLRAAGFSLRREHLRSHGKRGHRHTILVAEAVSLRPTAGRRRKRSRVNR